jgi:peroxiredoxin
MTSDLEQSTLGAQLHAHLAAARAGRHDEVNEAANELIRGLLEATSAAALSVGDTAPEFVLPDARGRDVCLGDLLERGPVVLVFYRGGWCPYCNLQLRAYERVLGSVRSLGAELVAVSPQLPDGSLSTVELNELSFPVLSDRGNRVARSYSLVFEVPPRIVAYYLDEKDVDLASINGDGSWELPVPGTFVIERSGRVAFAEVDPDYTRRAEPAALLRALRDLTG